MRAVVTGGTGLIGRALVAELCRLGWEVDCLGRHPPEAPRPGVRHHQVDLNQPASLTAGIRASKDASALFHLAAVMPHHSPAPDDAEYVRANVLASLEIFRAAMEWGIERVVYASGVSVIGTPAQQPVTESHPTAPRSAYTISKLGGELFAEYLRNTRGLKVTSLRLASPYGPGMSPSSVLPRFAMAALRGLPLTWFGSGSRSQNFVHVTDAANACMLAATRGAGGVYNIGGPESISMKALAQLLVDLTPGTGSSATASGRADPQEDERWEVSLTRARDELGYVPAVRLRDGLKDYLERMRTEARRETGETAISHSPPTT
ncbi:MAG TPA: NAD(P)-dependent oxidoreductase [Gemmatimonadales bacterium]|nr:NAD(P)-dependent oxidoreductase [Gemmatimonadales bacterium]